MASDYESEEYHDYSPTDVKDQGKKTVNKKPWYYPSNTPGQFIKNAITGVEYPWRTGSIDSQRLFKVVDALGNCDSLGHKIKPSSKAYPNPSPNQCYYDSPEEFMTHRRMTLQPAFIQQWEARQERFTPMHM